MTTRMIEGTEGNPGPFGVRTASTEEVCALRELWLLEQIEHEDWPLETLIRITFGTDAMNRFDRLGDSEGQCIQ